MTKRAAPTTRMRRLAAELKALREAAGMTKDQVQDRTAINRATLYRIETASQTPQERTLRALLDLYGVPGRRRAQLVEMLDRSRDESWLIPPDTIPDQYATYIGFEQEAKKVLNYEGAFAPGLVQTEAYARAVIQDSTPDLTSSEVDDRVSARMARQKREQPLALEAIVDEAVLHRQVGGVEVMGGQLRRLLDDIEAERVTLRVVPFTAGAHPGMHGPFAILRFAGDVHDVVYTETGNRDLFLESEDDVRQYALTFDRLRARAASPEESLALIGRALDGLK